MKDTRIIRPVAQSWKDTPTIEGAGVRIRRVFGFHQLARLDPFLLLDSFRSENPDDYRRGFPWHPHRGIETITYLLDGEVEHGDSMKNRGLIRPGDVQWMTAGRGIIHQEMPKGDRKGRMAGFQLWSNLPAQNKLMDPRYREVKKDDIPVVKTADGATVRVIAGEVGGVKGPVRDVVAGPELLDVSIPAGNRFVHDVAAGRNVFTYVFEGDASFGPEPAMPASDGTITLFGDGSAVEAVAGPRGARFLLASGTPLREPIAWSGPIVMNTQEELRLAFEELDAGTFLEPRKT